MSEDKKVMEKYYKQVYDIADSDTNKMLLEKLKSRYDNLSKTGPEAILADAAEISESEIRVLTDLISKWMRPPDIQAACETLVKNCIIINCERKIACINEILKNTELTSEERTALLKETAAIIEERKKYKNGK